MSVLLELIFGEEPEQQVEAVLHLFDEHGTPLSKFRTPGKGGAMGALESAADLVRSVCKFSSSCSASSSSSGHSGNAGEASGHAEHSADVQGSSPEQHQLPSAEEGELQVEQHTEPAEPEDPQQLAEPQTAIQRASASVPDPRPGRTSGLLQRVVHLLEEVAEWELKGDQPTAARLAGLQGQTAQTPQLLAPQQQPGGTVEQQQAATAAAPASAVAAGAPCWVPRDVERLLGLELEVIRLQQALRILQLEFDSRTSQAQALKHKLKGAECQAVAAEARAAELAEALAQAQAACRQLEGSKEELAWQLEESEGRVRDLEKAAAMVAAAAGAATSEGLLGGAREEGSSARGGALERRHQHKQQREQAADRRGREWRQQLRQMRQENQQLRAQISAACGSLRALGIPASQVFPRSAAAQLPLASPPDSPASLLHTDRTVSTLPADSRPNTARSHQQYHHHHHQQHLSRPPVVPRLPLDALQAAAQQQQQQQADREQAVTLPVGALQASTHPPQQVHEAAVAVAAAALDPGHLGLQHCAAGELRGQGLGRPTQPQPESAACSSSTSGATGSRATLSLERGGAPLASERGAELARPQEEEPSSRVIGLGGGAAAAEQRASPLPYPSAMPRTQLDGRAEPSAAGDGMAASAASAAPAAGSAGRAGPAAPRAADGVAAHPSTPAVPRPDLAAVVRASSTEVSMGARPVLEPSVVDSSSTEEEPAAAAGCGLEAVQEALLQAAVAELAASAAAANAQRQSASLRLPAAVAAAEMAAGQRNPQSQGMPAAEESRIGRLDQASGGAVWDALRQWGAVPTWEVMHRQQQQQHQEAPMSACSDGGGDGLIAAWRPPARHKPPLLVARGGAEERVGALGGKHGSAGHLPTGPPGKAQLRLTYAHIPDFQEVREAYHAVMSSEDDKAARWASKLSSKSAVETNPAKVESMMQGLMQLFQESGVPVPLRRTGPCQFALGSARMVVRLVNGRLMVRSGSSNVDIFSWLAKQPVPAAAAVPAGHR